MYCVYVFVECFSFLWREKKMIRESKLNPKRKNTYEVTNLVNEICILFHKVRRVSLLQQHMYMYGLNRNMY
jgi:hypothetical protein